MSIKDLLLRSYIVLSHYKPKVFTSEEKEKTIIPQMIEANRKADLNVLHSESKFLTGLTIQKKDLANSGGWLISSPNNPQSKIIYYIHGGGFTSSSTKERMRFIQKMVKDLHFNVFSIDYRLAPEFTQPSALLDCVDGYNYLLRSYKPEDIVIVGESAGGNLSIVLSMYLRDHKLPLPKAVYANSAPTQFSEITESYKLFSLKTDFVATTTIIPNIEGIYFKKEEIKDPYVSPLYGDLKDLPPITLSASQCECLLDDSIMLYGKLKAAGNEGTLLTYPGLWHAFIMSPQNKKILKEAYPDFERFLMTNLQ
ncbi:MAG: alpha/beta hydrolase [Bacilli bacterium]|jgi:acetyl esterase/lipase|nr:alpha/beta hydrolase [Bacilli bacterium]